MSRIVLDCSVVIAWAIRDNEPAERADTVISRGGVVPAVWPIEVANVLLVAERRGRIAPEETQGVVARLARVPVTVEPASSRTAFGPVLTLARSL